MWLQARDKTLIYHNWTKTHSSWTEILKHSIYEATACLFYALGRKKCLDTLFSFMWYLVLLKVHPQSLKGSEKVVSPTKFSMTQQVLLKKRECHNSSTSYSPETYVNHTTCCNNKLPESQDAHNNFMVSSQWTCRPLLAFVLSATRR